MLTKSDIDFIKRSRDEMQTNRFRDVIIRGRTKVGERPITGEPIFDDISTLIDAVVTEVSVRTSVDRYLDDGIEIRTGDIIVDIDLDEMPLDKEEAHSLDYDGKNYTIIAADKLGLGAYNRVEIIGRMTK